ncbi:MAG: hypothetical protein FWD66_01115 [Paludibacter sp.]|nr:hypothetical protein [Paludibacter sp.]
MRVSLLKHEQRFESRNDKTYGIQTYGENNDYPQKVMEIVAASCTGSSCLDNYKKFISGEGFTDLTNYEKIVNTKGQTLDYVLNEIAKDYATFGGFALHVNYNANFQIIEIQNVPFEHIRFEKLDDNGEFNRVAVHPDWGRRFVNLRKWKKDDIIFYNLYNPNPEEIKRQVPQIKINEVMMYDFNSYNGQIFYYSNNGEKVYPLPTFDDSLTDMQTEEAISDILYRNANHSFLPAGMLIEKISKSPDNEGQQEQKKQNTTDTEKSMLEFQGPKNTSKIMYVAVESDEEKPEFAPFRTNNYDKEFTVSNDTARDKIGRSFNQPPILRCEDVGGNFGSDLMTNAYIFYNSQTRNERLAIERVFMHIFKNWHLPINLNFEISQLKYV